MHAEGHIYLDISNEPFKTLSFHGNSTSPQSSKNNEKNKYTNLDYKHRNNCWYHLDRKNNYCMDLRCSHQCYFHSCHHRSQLRIYNCNQQFCQNKNLEQTKSIIVDFELSQLSKEISQLVTPDGCRKYYDFNFLYPTDFAENKEGKYFGEYMKIWFIKRVDKGWITTAKDLESLRLEQ